MEFLIIVLLLITPTIPLQARPHNSRAGGRAYARGYAKNLETLGQLRAETDRTLDSIIQVATVNLRSEGYSDLANQIDHEWKSQWKGAIISEKYDIGHIFLSKWLEQTYDKIEFALGVQTCKSLHLSDIKTINCAIPVIFNPCHYDMTGVLESRKQDYRDHFSHGAVYYGLAPVLTWWGCTTTCWTFTAGLGGFLCSIASSGAEWTMGYVISPSLSDGIFTSLCGE